MIKRRIDSVGKDLRDPAKRQMSLAYQGAVEAVFSILMCAGLGYWADEHWGSEPKGLIIGVVIGFSSFALRLVRLGKEMTDMSEADGQNNSQEEKQETKKQ